MVWFTLISQDFVHISICSPSFHFIHVSRRLARTLVLTLTSPEANYMVFCKCTLATTKCITWPHTFTFQGVSLREYDKKAL